MTEIQLLEKEIMEKIAALDALRKKAPPTPVGNYLFQTQDGKPSLLDLFSGKNRLFAIHNMGQGCRYCTLWADGLNAFLPHLESAFAVVLLSKDSPAEQRAFANSRGWRFRMASHGGGDYIKEQSVVAGQDNMPGIVCYERRGDQIYKLNSAVFGPGDLYCPIWHILGLAGVGEDQWTPQYSYWKRPQKLSDGGLNILE
ncbi:MAG TPA: DUF899 family protein [Tepidisphaeraceae bacterium]|jgi:predicted dithiol-disulfide oxidoreductase (DUF899 family)|nr:DUF899 family protein [Tepidisphaeraceae bacterium]